MATTVRNNAGGQGLAAVDALWTLYLSQPQRVKKAFRMRIESLEKHEDLWLRDLKEIQSLKQNWDNAGAPIINRGAISATKKHMSLIDSDVSKQVRLLPTPMGAIMLQLETGKGRLKCEVGNDTMSYFVKKSGFATEHHSYEELTDENIVILKNHLKSLL